MSVALEGPRQVGAARVAVLTEHRVGASGGAGHAVFTGEKRALAVLIRQGAETGLYPLDPKAASWPAVKALCPEAMAALDD